MPHKLNTKILTRCAILTAISVILMSTLKIPLPFLPPFLTLDISNVPIIILALTFGKRSVYAGILSVLAKDIIHLFVTNTGGVGELADFISSCSLIIPISAISSRKRNTSALITGLTIGTVLMTIAGTLSNKFILLPFYSRIIPIDEIFLISSKINPLITDETSYILFGVIPFNIIKGIVVSVIAYVVYGKLRNTKFMTNKK